MKIRLAAIRLILVPALLFASFTVSAQQSDSVSQLGNNQLRVSKINLQSLPSHKNYLSPKSLIIPTTMIVYGFTSLNSVELQKLNKNICEEVVEDSRGFNTRADDYLKYAPAASVYLLNFVGVKGRHGFVDRSIILVASTILSSQLVTALKHGTHQLRPDGSTYNSFPSGHTTTAFIGAELMN